MSCCAKKIARICNPIGTCAGSTLELPYTGLSGIYTIVFYFLNAVVRYDVTANSNGKLVLLTDGLNESYTYTGEVYKDSIKVLFFTDYDAFRLTTYIGAGVTNIGGTNQPDIILKNLDGTPLLNTDETTPLQNIS